MQSKVYFFYLSGAKKGKIEAGQGRVIRIGRQPYCEIALDPHQDIPASGEHAQVVCEPNGTFTLHDASSSWGTYKNDIRIHGPVPLTTGDVITLGVDDTGRPGPKLKFYLETDILRCPACSGPVYKRHFKCPKCVRKYCLRCIDFQRKICRPCAQAPEDPGYEIVPDDAPAAKPARVVVRGKDAERARRAQQRRSGSPVEASGSGSSRIKAGSSRSKGGNPFGVPEPPPLQPDKRTKVMPGAKGKKRKPPADPGIIAEPVGDPLAAVKSDMLFSMEEDDPAGSEPVLKVPDLDDLQLPGMEDIVTADRYPKGAPPQQGRGRTQPTKRQARQPKAGPGRQDKSPTGSFLPPENKIDVRRPASIPCERCNAPLAPRDFFICDACRSRLCSKHRTGTSVCDQCSRLPAVNPAQTGPAPQTRVPGTGRPGRVAGGGSGAHAPLPARGAAPPPPRPAPIPRTMKFGRPPRPGALPVPGPANGPPRTTPPRRPARNQDMVDTLDDETSGSSWNRAIQDFVETDDAEDDLAVPPPGTVSGQGLAAVKFECPYCDRLLQASARHCPHCKKIL